MSAARFRITARALVTLFAFVGMARAQSAPINKRIVIHGVACAGATEEVCANTRPVLDEAAAVLKDEQDGAVAVHVGADPDMGTNEDGNLTQPSPERIREYLVANGIAPELIELR